MISRCKSGRIFPSPYNNRGLIFLRHGELQRAYDEFNIALSLNSGNNSTSTCSISGACRLLRKQYDIGAAYFAEGKPLVRRRWEIACYRCITYTELGRFDEALADCNEVIAKYPKFAGPLARRGNAYREKGDLDAALKDYNERSSSVRISSMPMSAARRSTSSARIWAAARSDYRSPAPR